jgi:radical SAM superfamily enzyme YgiQ (UPF0313 family)
MPVSYNEPVFRPPAEANSVIIQATIGCSWNRCSFCEMYTTKQFRKRLVDDIKSEIKAFADYYRGIRKIFLADGNAFVLSAKFLIPILEEIKIQFKNVQRISSYALPADILSKSEDELITLRQLGLKLLYLGIESGDDELLRLINKGETYKSTVEGIQKANKAGIDTSIMVINGLGGRIYSEQHSIQSAKLVNEVNPKFLSVLTLSLPFGQAHFEKRFQGIYEPQTLIELAVELKQFIRHIDNINSIFRSDHVSNYLVLKGVLSRDKGVFINTLDSAIGKMKADDYPACHPVL